VPSFAVSPATVIDGEPERAQQVVFVGDTSRRHDDGRDRVVHDLLLCSDRYTAALAAASQFSDQFAAAAV
jgi:hypothetical protein